MALVFRNSMQRTGLAHRTGMFGEQKMKMGVSTAFMDMCQHLNIFEHLGTPSPVWYIIMYPGIPLFNRQNFYPHFPSCFGPEGCDRAALRGWTRWKGVPLRSANSWTLVWSRPESGTCPRIWVKHGEKDEDSDFLKNFMSGKTCMFRRIDSGVKIGDWMGLAWLGLGR